MDTKNSDWLVKLHVAVLVFILALLPLHAFISTWGGTAVGPLEVWKAWKEILLLALLPFTIWLLAIRRDIWHTLSGRWYNWAILAYAALNGIWAAFSPASWTAVSAGLIMNLRFLAIFLVAQIVVAAGGGLAEMLKWLFKPWILCAAIGLAGLAVLQVVVLPADFLKIFGYGPETIAPSVLVDQNPEFLRAFATLRGPNDLGAYLLLPLSLAIAIVIAKRASILAWAALAAGSLALVLTGSRSAWLGMVVSAIAVAAITLPAAKMWRIIKLGAIPLLVLAGLLFWLAASVPALRLAIFHSSPGDSSLLEGSSEQHWAATIGGTARALEQPLGHGLGTAGPASYYNQNAPPLVPENYFVQIALETGLVGLALLLAVCWGAARALWRNRRDHLAVAVLASLAGATVVNMLLHGWADDPLALTWWAAAGLLITDGGRNGHAPHKKAKRAA